MKLTADKNGMPRFFTAKLGWKEHFDSREIEMLTARAVQALIPPVVVQGRKNNVIKFDVSPYSTLEFYLCCVLSREQFAEILLQCVDIFRQVQQMYLNYKNLVFDLDKIYIQLETRRIYWIYLPLLESKREASIPDFFKSVVQRASRSTYEQVSFLDAAQAWLTRPAPFVLEEFRAFVESNVYTAPGGTSYPPERGPGGSAMSGGIGSAVSGGGIGGGIGSAVSGGGIGGGLGSGAGGGLGNGLWEARGSRQPDGGAIQHTAYMPQDAGGDGGTILLGESMPEPGRIRYYLKRAATGELIEISSSPFLVGTKAGSVSYCISDNAAVSRRHAEFTIRDGFCTVTDQKSTNKTYVNDCVLTPFAAQRLSAGDQIVLGNERFTFSQEGPGGQEDRTGFLPNG